MERITVERFEAARHACLYPISTGAWVVWQESDQGIGADWRLATPSARDGGVPRGVCGLTAVALAEEVADLATLREAQRYAADDGVRRVLRAALGLSMAYIEGFAAGFDRAGMALAAWTETEGHERGLDPDGLLDGLACGERLRQGATRERTAPAAR
jgi:hypothetical protein